MTNKNQNNNALKGMFIGSNPKLKQRFVDDLVSACLFKHLYPMLMAAQERYQMPILPEEVEKALRNFIRAEKETGALRGIKGGRIIVVRRKRKKTGNKNAGRERQE